MSLCQGEIKLGDINSKILSVETAFKKISDRMRFGKCIYVNKNKQTNKKSQD